VSPTPTAPDDVPWRIRHPNQTTIAGYANTTSVAPGQPVTLFVSTRAPSFRVAVFRMGWYAGTKGSLVERSPTIAGHVQARAAVHGATHTVVAPWRAPTRLSTTRWPAGDYLLRLDASTGAQSFVPLTVRGPTARGKVVLVSPVTTWQAYNLWGCCSLYAGANGSFATRSRAVSFDRPYKAEDGAGEFIERELPVLAQAERLGLHLDYLTSIDVDLHPHVLDGAAAVISMGHDEYWSSTMRSAVTRVRDAGTNLAFLGANAMFRHIRFAPSRNGPDRIEIDYKIATEDPYYGHHNSLVTSDWPAPPDPRPESAVVGASYNCFTRTKSAAVVVEPSSPLFRGTGVRAGTRLAQLIGPETDHVVRGSFQPRPVEILMHSPFPCPGGRVPADATYYTVRSGAGVFDTGTMSWVCALGGTCSKPATTAVVRRVTNNLLQLFAAGPAGRTMPAKDNVARIVRH